MKHILVVGGAGYIGSHTVKKLIESGYQVTVFDNLEAGHREVVELLNANLVIGDLRTPADLRQLDNIDFDACMHFAAYASVGESVVNPKKYFNNNFLGTMNLLDYLSDRNINKFIFSSTSEVYGESAYLPIDENHNLTPINPYGLSKRMVEQTLEWFDKAYGFKYVVLRYFNAAGCSMDGKIGEMHEPENHLIPNAVLGVMGKKKFKMTCSKVDTLDGTPIRDFIHVDDLALAHVKALEYLIKGGSSECINLGTGKGFSVLEVIEVVEQVSGKEIEKKIGDVREGEPAKKYASNKKAKDVLNWEPEYDINDMVSSTYSYFIKNLD